MDLRWHDNKCPYCGAERVKLSKSRVLEEKFGVTYSVCKCDEAQADLKRSKDITDFSEDVDRQIEFCEGMIENIKKNSEKMLKESLGRRFADRTFKSFIRNEENGRAFDICYEYAMGFEKNEKGEGLILCGNPGTGKTHLAAAISHKVIEEFGIPVEFKTSIEIHSELTNFEKETLNKYKKCDLLIIDDLGKEKTTEWRQEKIFEIINSRYEDYLPTLITTNLAPKQFAGVFGEAFASRLIESNKVVPVTGKDWRRK